MSLFELRFVVLHDVFGFLLNSAARVVFGSRTSITGLFIVIRDMFRLLKDKSYREIRITYIERVSNLLQLLQKFLHRDRWFSLGYSSGEVNIWRRL